MTIKREGTADSNSNSHITSRIDSPDSLDASINIWVVLLKLTGNPGKYALTRRRPVRREEVVNVMIMRQRRNGHPGHRHHRMVDLDRNTFVPAELDPQSCDRIGKVGDGEKRPLLAGSNVVHD